MLHWRCAEPGVPDSIHGPTPTLDDGRDLEVSNGGRERISYVRTKPVLVLKPRDFVVKVRRQARIARPAIARVAPRVALAHDWLVDNRGGEAVLAHLARVALERGEPGRLYTLFDGHGPYSNAIDEFPVRTSGLNRLPARARRWLRHGFSAAMAARGPQSSQSVP